jgi:hypothetical protein
VRCLSRHRHLHDTLFWLVGDKSAVARVGTMEGSVYDTKYEQARVGQGHLATCFFAVFSMALAAGFSQAFLETIYLLPINLA